MGSMTRRLRRRAEALRQYRSLPAQRWFVDLVEEYTHKKLAGVEVCDEGYRFTFADGTKDTVGAHELRRMGRETGVIRKTT